ncbi:MAG: hypothetical protein KDA83_13220 [Planctomycetales bacterium]|nr:hypothetical protein [Planctomycetales bacterium]
MPRRSLLGSADLPRPTSRTWFSRSFLRGAVGILLLTSVGCDLGTYSSRYSERLPQLQRRGENASYLNNYQSLEISTVISGAPVAEGNSTINVGAQIRLPMIFDNESRKLGPNDPPSIAAPPGMQLPIGLAYERYITNENSDRLPIYFYLIAIPTEKADLTTVETDIDTVLATIVENSGGWKSLSVDTLDDSTLDYRALRVSQAQPFVVQLVDNAPQPQTLEGQLHFYARTVGDYHLIFVFRYPSQVADSLNFPAAIEASLGTLKQ